MRVDTQESIYHEARDAADEFSRKELRRCRYLLRRLRFIEAKLEKTGGMATSSAGGAAHAEWEVEALEWVLSEIRYLDPVRDRRMVQS